MVTCYYRYIKCSLVFTKVNCFRITKEASIPTTVIKTKERVNMTLGPNPQVDPHSGIVIHTMLAMPVIGNDIVLGEKLTCTNLYNIMNSLKSNN